MNRRFLITAAFGIAGMLVTGAAAEPRLVLKGYDPVAYFTIGEPTPGHEEFETVFDSARYRFSSTDHQTLFEGDPEAYLPQYAGNCTGAMAMGRKVEADPANWRIVDGKLYVFRGWVDPEFDEDPQAVIAKAEENWPKFRDQTN